jgi:hypothetical protein
MIAMSPKLKKLRNWLGRAEPIQLIRWTPVIMSETMPGTQWTASHSLMLLGKPLFRAEYEADTPRKAPLAHPSQ